MNCDWDHMRAVDLLVLMESFKPLEGGIKNVKVYPSDFGLQRMAEEEKCGPTLLREKIGRWVLCLDICMDVCMHTWILSRGLCRVAQNLSFRNLRPPGLLRVARM